MGRRGHRVIAGTPEQVADSLEEWFRNGAADGFNIMPPHLPGGLTDFVDQVVPELVRRGLFRSEYTGKTLPEHYGLRRPDSQYPRVAPTRTVPRCLATHQIGGFHPELALSVAGAPPTWVPVVLIAVGCRAPAERLPPRLAERERAPRVRRPLSELVLRPGLR